MRGHLHRHGDAERSWFDDADRYDRHAGRVAGRLWRRVAADVAALDLPAGAHVLDVGTGPGRLPLAVAERCPRLRVSGVDVSAAMVGRARRTLAGTAARERVTVEVGDVAALPYPDRSVELVVSTLSQHHWPDPAAGFRELARVLAPGGQAWVYDVRWALGRAEAAARAAFDGYEVRREPVRARHLPVYVVTRLTIAPAAGTPR